MPAVAALWGDKACETAVNQLLALRSQQCDTGEIDFRDQPLARQGEVTDRGELVEIHIAVAGLFQRGIGAPQLFILHFQFDLMHLELVQQFLGRAGRRLFQRCVGKLGFSRLAQQSGAAFFFK